MTRESYFLRVHSYPTTSKMVSYFYRADADYGQRLIKSLKLEQKNVTSLVKN